MLTAAIAAVVTVTALSEAIGETAAVVVAIASGLAALVYLARAARRLFRSTRTFIRRVDAVVDLADTELRHNGGSTIKDAVSVVPQLDSRLRRVEQRLNDHLGADETPGRTETRDTA